jgi:DNA repair photolyase
MNYITLAGEPAINTSWALKLKDMKDDEHLTLITKNPGAFIKSELEYAIEQNKGKVTLYICITGYGKTPMEPEVIMPITAMMSMKYLIDKGYDVVLYINPIIPTTSGFEKVRDVIGHAHDILGSLKNLKIKIDFIQHISNCDARGLELPWITEESNSLPREDNEKLGLISINTIIEYFMSIEFQDDAIIQTDNKSINMDAWFQEKVERIEILDGDDLYTQCEYGCRYCYLNDRYDNSSE